MNANLQRAQEAYDAMLPDESEAFLDTTEGANWLAHAGETLVYGDDLKIGGRSVVQAYDLSDAVATEAIRRVEDCEDDDGMLGQLLVAVANYDIAKASRCLKKLLAPSNHPVSAVNEMAEALAAQHAKAAEEQMRREAEEEWAEMRAAS